MLEQEPIFENQSSHVSGHIITSSCYCQVSEISSGSPLISCHHAQAQQKLRRITSDAMDRITEIQLSKNHMHYGPLTAIPASELKSIYGSDMYTSRVRRERSKHLTQVLRGFKHEGMKYGVVSLYSPTPLQITHTLNRVDERIAVRYEQIEQQVDQLIAANRAIDAARRASNNQTHCEFKPAQHEVELLGTCYELDRAIELADPIMRLKYITFKNRCRIDGDKLFFQVSYKEDWTGRRHCQQLVGIPVPVREHMFKGFDYHDIESCMPSVWIQMYKQLNLDEPTPVLDEYFADVHTARVRMMDLLDVDYSRAKAIYNCSWGGMSIPWCVGDLERLMSLKKQPAILKLLTPGQALRLGLTDWFREYWREMRMVQKAIRRHHRKNNRHVVTNAAGKKLFLKDWRDYKHINTFLWMGVERQILDVARKYCNPAVTLHDGFITKDKITAHEYEQLVFEQTGWRITDKIKHLGDVDMQQALKNNILVDATKGQVGICPHCGTSVIAKCGDIKSHHWAHVESTDCDYYHPEGTKRTQDVLPISHKRLHGRVKQRWEYSEPQWRKELSDAGLYPKWQELPDETPTT